MKRLTRQDVEAATAPHYIPTSFGLIGIRRISGTEFLNCLPFFRPPEQAADGTWTDPMKVGFRDVRCPACYAPEGRPCKRFAGDTGTHDARVELAKQVRDTRGIRVVLQAAVVDPKPTRRFLQHIEASPDAFKDLAQQVMNYQALTKRAHDEAKATFPEGVPSPETVPGCDVADPGVSNSA